MNHTTLSIVHLSTSPVVSNLVSIQATSPHPVLPWTHPSHRSIQCSLELSKPPIHSSAPLDSTKPPVHLNAPLDYPSHRFTPIGVVLFHCTCLQRSLHFCAYTLAMQSMVSAFIQHPSTYPSRYIIIGLKSTLETSPYSPRLNPTIFLVYENFDHLFWL
jgi:hypothetical protein